MIYPLPLSLQLLLIDGQGTLDGLYRTVQQWGVKIAFASEGERGYARAITLRPDAILLGLPLRKGNGMAILQMLKANHATADIPVLVLSDEGTPAARVEAFRNGAADYIVLPANDEEIQARIAIHLRLAGRYREGQTSRKTSASNTALPEQGDNEVLVSAAQTYVRNHLAEIPNTRTIAHQLDVSDRRLIEAFRSRLGLTPFEYLRKERMQRAEALLRTTPLSLRALASEVGYSSAANLVTAFRDYFGMPPAQYRREKDMSRRKREITISHSELL